MKTGRNIGFGGDSAQGFPSPIETLPQVKSTLPPAPEEGMAGEGSKENHGFTCKQCSTHCSTSHGFARHLARHGFGTVGKHLGG